MYVVPKNYVCVHTRRKENTCLSECFQIFKTISEIRSKIDTYTHIPTHTKTTL